MGALALAAALLAFLAAGCGNGSRHAAAAATATPTTPTHVKSCKLNAAQKHAVARALTDIRRLRRIQAPMQAYSVHGAPGQNQLTGKFLLDAGSANLPLNVFTHLIDMAKVATNLCGDCSQGLEADAPVLGNRDGMNRCA